MKFILLLPLIVFVSLAFFFWRGLSLNPTMLPSAEIGRSVPNFKLPLLNKPETLFDSKTLQGKVVLLNVWASWCEACASEHQFLLDLAHDGVLIYGLNYKDNALKARNWLNELGGSPYQAVFMDEDGKVAIDLGVYGAPETFLLDRSGAIRYRYPGILDENVWEKEFLPRIKECENAKKVA